MSLVTGIRDLAASAALFQAQVFGVQIDIVDPINGTLTGVWALIDKTSQTTQLREGVTDKFTFIITVPRQLVGATQFPWPTLSPGVAVVYPSSTGTKYEVDLVEPDNMDLSLCSTIQFTCGRYGQDSADDV